MPRLISTAPPAQRKARPTSRAFFVPSPFCASAMNATTMHFMCGAGGDAAAFATEGFHVTDAVNHEPACTRTVELNLASVRTHLTDVTNLDMRRMPRVSGLVGSPICTELSLAGGQVTPSAEQLAAKSADRSWARTRATAWCLLRYAEAHRPLFVAGENVVEFGSRWPLLRPWIACWEALGYRVQLVSVNAAHLSAPDMPAVPQLRDRILFAITKADLPLPDLELRPEAICPYCGPVQAVRIWQTPLGASDGIGWYKGKGPRRSRAYHYVCPTCETEAEPITTPFRPHIDWHIPGTPVRDGRPRDGKPYAPDTRARIQSGLERFGDSPFLVICRNHGGPQSLDGPVATLTAGGNHHMIVWPGATVDDSEVRMVRWPEKLRLQGFPEGYRLAGATETVNGMLTGNAVPVPTGRWLARRLQASLN
jgi:site-specific DNA-cytosine methylase